LGTHNFPPYRNTTQTDLRANWSCLRPAGAYSCEPTRDLEFFEQFAWVDCTNLFSDRNGFTLSATVDVTMTDGTEPMLWANLYAWKAYKAAAAEKAAEERRVAAEALRVAEAKKAAVAAQRQAKEVALMQAAELRLCKAPAKGTTVTVDGFTGKIFWMGVNKFRGNFKASYGVKDARGNVKWVELPA
jgi:hypothetical protein